MGFFCLLFTLIEKKCNIGYNFKTMYILVKKIDEYKSKVHKNKIVPEFIIYLMIDNTPIEANTVLGEREKDNIVLNYYNKFAWQTQIKIVEKN